MPLSRLEIKQLELLKNKKPAERFALMAQLIDAQFKAMKAGIKYNNPNMSDTELHKCLRNRMKEIYSLKL